MKITKTQIDYLHNRLKDIRNEKVAAFKQAQPAPDFTAKWTQIYKDIKDGKVSMYSLKDFLGNIRSWCNPDIKDLFNLKKIDEDFEKKEQIIQDYTDKLDKKMTEIMDKVVLSDLLIEEAVAEFKKM